MQNRRLEFMARVAIAQLMASAPASLHVAMGARTFVGKTPKSPERLAAADAKRARKNARRAALTANSNQ